MKGNGLEKLPQGKAPGTAIDLRSDTVTRPTAAMRQAMAAAEVGDDVYGEDPTVNRLEARAAEIFAREAALFVPTGSMGNQIAIRLHTQPGQEVICEARAHILDWEMATAAVFSGCLLRPVAAERGILTWADVQPAIAAGLAYRSATGLISLENTHNMAGGSVTPREVIAEICHAAGRVGLPVHLDGARIFHAAVALGIDVAALTAGVDTVMFCLSKGLGAPVGSMLVGSRDHMARARVFRKALGGGMRQAGVLAAAGLIALEQGPARLEEDHRHARLLGEAISGSGAADLLPVETNIVIFRPRGMEAEALRKRLAQKGVLSSSVGSGFLRLVTHRDVSHPDCVRAAAILAEEMGESPRR